MAKSKGNAFGYDKYIGMMIHARNYETTGVITGIVKRWCAGCQAYRPVYSVKWENGRRTYPCPSGCEDKDGAVHIL